MKRIFLLTSDEHGIFHFQEHTSVDALPGAVYDNWGEVDDQVFECYALPGTLVVGRTAVWQSFLESLLEDEDEAEAQP